MRITPAGLAGLVALSATCAPIAHVPKYHLPVDVSFGATKDVVWKEVLGAMSELSIPATHADKDSGVIHSEFDGDSTVAGKPGRESFECGSGAANPPPVKLEPKLTITVFPAEAGRMAVRIRLIDSGHPEPPEEEEMDARSRTMVCVSNGRIELEFIEMMRARMQERRSRLR
jgi:hypothetical protein